MPVSRDVRVAATGMKWSMARYTPRATGYTPRGTPLQGFAAVARWSAGELASGMERTEAVGLCETQGLKSRDSF